MDSSTIITAVLSAVGTFIAATIVAFKDNGDVWTFAADASRIEFDWKTKTAKLME